MVVSTQKFRQKTLSPQVAPQAPPPTMISPEGAVAQLAERFPRTEEAGSSNLLRSTQMFPQVQGPFPGSSAGLHSDDIRRGIRQESVSGFSGLDLPASP